MSRVPPGLLYLTIYNPTLKATGPTLGDDEDAEEQAQILFYTGRERAVSRDKILRQVGLAKALVNFTGMFSSSDVCENTHSQSRRMVMVSPEPNFWIHACVEVAKTPRPVPSKGKSKVAGKTAAPQEVVYDYHDSSVHDLALRARILRGYESFKVTHGSFASILSSLGQQALELQVERFFTVWAWSWDLEDDMNFGDHLGVPMHPSLREQVPILDEFSSELLNSFVTFVLVPPYVIPSTKLIDSGYPNVLISHILSRIPPPAVPTSQDSPSTSSNTGPEKPVPNTSLTSASDAKNNNLTLRAASPFMNMDMRNLKWMWSGLTFSKGSSAKPTAPPTPSIAATEQHELQSGAPPPPEGNPELKLQVPESLEVEVDAESLQEAITSENVHGVASTVPSPSREDTQSLSPSTQDDPAGSAPEGVHEGAGDEHATVDPGADGADDDEPAVDAPTDDFATPTASHLLPPDSVKPASLAPPPEFLATTVHLAKGHDPSETKRHKVHHATQGVFTFGVVVGEDDTIDLPTIAENLPALFRTLEATLSVEKSSDDAATPVTKLLQPQTKYIISTGAYTSSSRLGFSSRSEHLFNGRQMVNSGFDVHEVFSRGQNPQHWHIAKRGLGINTEGAPVHGEVFMEVARKESTLTDVDNELAGTVRRFTE